jgi:hypothetical protein
MAEAGRKIQKGVGELNLLKVLTINQNPDRLPPRAMWQSFFW